AGRRGGWGGGCGGRGVGWGGEGGDQLIEGRWDPPGRTSTSTARRVHPRHQDEVTSGPIDPGPAGGSIRRIAGIDAAAGAAGPTSGRRGETRESREPATGVLRLWRNS